MEMTIDEIIGHCNRTCENTEMLAVARGQTQEDITSKGYWEHYHVAKYLEELKRMKDAEDQGLLLRLPCKAGDAVWYVEEYCTPKIVRGVVDGYLWYRSCGFALNVVWDEPIMAHFAYTRKEMPFSDIGRCVFLTREEAEAALAEKGGA